jgi:STE24 endopeptidase
VEKHTTDELVAVLAHEIGHYKKKHTRTSLLLGIVQSGLMLFIFSRFIDSPGLSQAMGSDEVKFQLGMLSFAILYSPISTLIGLMMNYISRLNEFAADRYASETFSAIPLKEALKKLSVHQLSNLHPHPWYVFFYYSHPPLMERLKALEKIAD